MNYFTDRTDQAVINALRMGKIGVLRTDTLYGIVALASDQQAVERTLTVRGRDPGKACIVLIADPRDMYDAPEPALQEFIDKQWPGPVSVAVPSPSAPDYLKFQDGTIAYRLPANRELRRLLLETGPLIAPSANPPGKQPAASVAEAEKYFGDKVDFYIDSGETTDATASQLWTYKNGEMQRLR